MQLEDLQTKKESERSFLLVQRPDLGLGVDGLAGSKRHGGRRAAAHVGRGRRREHVLGAAAAAGCGVDPGRGLSQ